MSQCQCQVCGGRATLWICPQCTNQLRALLTSLATGPAVNGRRSSGLLEDLTDVALKRTRLGSDTGHRKRGDTKQINVADQVKVKRADRIHLVNLKPVKPEPPKSEDDDE